MKKQFYSFLVLSFFLTVTGNAQPKKQKTTTTQSTTTSSSIKQHGNGNLRDSLSPYNIKSTGSTGHTSTGQGQRTKPVRQPVNLRDDRDSISPYNIVPVKKTGAKNNR